MSSEKKSGFLIMPFARDLDWVHEACVNAGVAENVSVVRADSIFESGSIIEQILEGIDRADVVLAVCTGKNANVFFELGYAWRNSSPILIAASTSDLPFDIASFRTVMYGGDGPENSADTFPFRLRRAIRAALEADRPLPKGRIVSRPAETQPRAQVAGRSYNSGKHKEFTVTNTGSVDLTKVNLELPENVSSMFVHRDDLPVDLLRRGESFNVKTVGMMGGGPRIFDVKITALGPDGEVVEGFFKVS